MLIIPIETKPNWNHPPFVTIVIILVNLIIFLAYQSNDHEIADEAARFYIDAGLIKKERKLLEQHILSLNDAHSRYLRNLRGHEQYNTNLAYYAFYTREFDEKIAREWSREIHPDEEWRANRKEFESHRDRYSSFAFGLTPAEPNLVNYISYAFLHGGWGHIVGNMVFLFLFGFLLELVVGPLLYLAIYLVTGVLAGWLFVLVNSDSHVPLVGASGAVSGLMGAYIVMYGLRKIKFFYTIGFYFGEFKAPALAIFPLWLAKEIYGHFQLNDQVAYIAHFGGLVSGALALWGIKHLRKEQTIQKIENFTTHTTQDPTVSRALKDISKHAEGLDFEGAQRKCKMYLAQNTSEIKIWQAYFDLAKLNAHDKNFHQVTFDFIKQAVTNADYFGKHSGVIRNVLEEYVAAVKNPVVIKNENLLIRLICFLFENHEQNYAAALLEKNLNALSTKKSALRTLQLAQLHYNQINNEQKSRQMSHLAEKLTHAPHN